MKDLTKRIGEKRTFTDRVAGKNVGKPYTVTGFVDGLAMIYPWIWKGDPCPHCRMPTDRMIEHEIFAAEVLECEGDTVVLGHTLDRRLMLIPKDRPEYQELIELTKKESHGK